MINVGFCEELLTTKNYFCRLNILIDGNYTQIF